MFQFKPVPKSDILNVSSPAVALLTLSAILFTPACAGGKNPLSQVITHLSVTTNVQNGDEWIQVSATLNTGGFRLTGVNTPITNPITKIEYGEFTLAPELSGTSQSSDLTISLDTTQISRLPNSTATLPNGTALPVGGLTNATTVAIPISNTGAELYFAFGRGIAMLGAAMSFSALDAAGKYGNGVDLFQPVNFGSIAVLAGIYGGAEPHTTGVGVFLDLSSVLNPSPNPGPSGTPSTTSLRELAGYYGAHPESTLVFQSLEPPMSEASRFYQELMELQKTNTILDLNQ